MINLASAPMGVSQTIEANDLQAGAVAPAIAEDATAASPPATSHEILGPTAIAVLAEVGKQAIDQPGHFLIGAAPIWASRYLVGVPWLGWVVAPILAYREWLQWPSRRWWDPPLDWGFLLLGAVAATCSRRPVHALTGGLVTAVGRATSGVAVSGRMAHAPRP